MCLAAALAPPWELGKGSGERFVFVVGDSCCWVGGSFCFFSMPITAWSGRWELILMWWNHWDWLFKKRQRYFQFGATVHSHISNVWIQVKIVWEIACVYWHTLTYCFFFPEGKTKNKTSFCSLLNSKGPHFWLTIWYYYYQYIYWLFSGKSKLPEVSHRLQ